MKNNIETLKARETWLQWSNNEFKKAEKGYVAMQSAMTGYSVVAAYDKELKTGIPHCACCQNPQTWAHAKI